MGVSEEETQSTLPHGWTPLISIWSPWTGIDCVISNLARRLRMADISPRPSQISPSILQPGDGRANPASRQHSGLSIIPFYVHGASYLDLRQVTPGQGSFLISTRNTTSQAGSSISSHVNRATPSRTRCARSLRVNLGSTHMICETFDAVTISTWPS